MKTLSLSLFAGAALSLIAADPSVAIDAVTQDVDGLVTVNYTLSGASAIITLDVETNATGDVWASVGGEALRDVAGNVYTNVATGARSFVWRPTGPASDFTVTAANTRLVVNAWTVDDAPDYLVVDLYEKSQPKRYYPYVECLPGGLLENADYRTKLLVLRRIHAKDVTWTMLGAFSVTLDHDYYIGVFELTQAQWMLCGNGDKTTYDCLTYRTQGAMRPAAMSYAQAREKTFYRPLEPAGDCMPLSAYPNPPWQYSLVGMMRTKFGLDFDLPTEAEWEFACRAGLSANDVWNDGSAATQANCPGRHKFNGGYLNGGTTAPDSSNNYDAYGITNGTTIVGSYRPNAWGLYDMHGNVQEWCLDWAKNTVAALAGAVNINSADPTKLVDGTTGTDRVRRGGNYGTTPDDMKMNVRGQLAPTTKYPTVGVRVVVRGGAATVSTSQK